jgi:hypothetical protein
VKVTFSLFQGPSGLRLNLQKSEILVTADQGGKAQILADVIHCQASAFPISHLEPLSDKKLSKESYYNIIQKEENRLAGWKADNLSLNRGKRLVLINSVHSAQPVYYMSIFLLPKWVIAKRDKIRKRFL